MDRRLARGEKARPDPAACCTEREHRGKATTIGYPARGNDRNGIDGVDHARNKRKGRDRAAHMPACLPPLGDDDVGSCVGRANRFIDAADADEDDGAPVMRLRHELRHVAPEK